MPHVTSFTVMKDPARLCAWEPLNVKISYHEVNSNQKYQPSFRISFSCSSHYLGFQSFDAAQQALPTTACCLIGSRAIETRLQWNEPSFEHSWWRTFNALLHWLGWIGPINMPPASHQEQLIKCSMLCQGLTLLSLEAKVDVSVSW